MGNERDKKINEMDGRVKKIKRLSIEPEVSRLLDEIRGTKRTRKNRDLPKRMRKRG